MGGVKIWWDVMTGRLNGDAKGQFLGEFDGDDKVLVIYKDGHYELSNYELINRFEPDTVYFIQKYIKVVSLDKGLVPFHLFDYQEDMINKIHDNRFIIAKLPRQSGKTTTVTSYLLHYILFNQSMNVAILANKQSTAKDILARLKLAYEYLPTWLQQGIKEWNKYSIALENGSRVIAAATSSSAIRGGSYNFLVLDE